MMTRRLAEDAADRSVRSALRRIYVSRAAAGRVAAWRACSERPDLPRKVFDPNCCRDRRNRRSSASCCSGTWDVVGVSTTGMTLRFDLELAHIVRRVAPRALHRRGRHGGDVPAGSDV